MGRTAIRAAALVAGLAAMARADDQAEKIRSALADLDGSVVLVRYNFETSKGQINILLGDPSGGSREKEGEGVCIGVILNDAGLILISGHVFPDPHGKTMAFGASLFGKATSPPKKFRVRTGKGEEIPARLLARDEDLNLAFLEVDAPDPAWKPVRFDFEGTMRVGDPFLIPTFLSKKYDYQPSFQMGRLTGVVKGEITRYLQSSVMSISAGSMGGPMNAMGAPVVAVDTGHVIGIIAEPKREAQPSTSATGLTNRGANVSFAFSVIPGVPAILPAAGLRDILRDPLAALGQKGWIGIEQLQPLTKELAPFFDRKEGAGAVVNLVGSGSPAETAGVLVEDLLVAIDGEAVRARDADGVNEILRRIRRTPVGTEITLTVLRDGVEHELPVTVAAAPRSVYDAETIVDEVFGVTLAEITYDAVQRKNLDPEDLGRVIVRKVPIAGLFSMAGLAVDDIILGLNGHEVPDIASARAMLAGIKEERSKEVLVKVKRGADTRFLKIQPDW